MTSGDYTPGQVLSSLSKKQSPTFKNEALKSLFSPVAEHPKVTKQSKKRSLLSPDSSEAAIKKPKKEPETSPEKKIKKKQKVKQEHVSENITFNADVSINQDSTLSESSLKKVKQEKRKSLETESESTSPIPSKRKKQKDLKTVIDREKSLRDADVDLVKKKKKKKKTGTENPESRTIFVGNLPISYTKKEIKKMFKQYGDIETVRLRSAAPADPSVPKKVVVVKKETHPERHNINAYIVFVNTEDAVKALALNGEKVEGLHIRVDLAGNSQKHDIKQSIFIGNLPFDVEEESLRNHFSDCGDIKNIRVIRDPKTGLGKGFGYIHFMSQDGVFVALGLDGKEFTGRKLRISRCVKKEKKKQLSDDRTASNQGQKFNKGKGTSNQERKFQKTDRKSKKPSRCIQPSNARPGSFMKKTVKKSKKGWKPSVSMDGKSVPKGQPNFVHARFRLQKKNITSKGRKK